MVRTLGNTELGQPSPERGSAPDAVRLLAADQLTVEELFGVVREVTSVRAGAEGYGATMVDPPGPEAAGCGLRAGLLLFDQASGALGGVLRLMHRRDPARFADAFGGAGDGLLAVLTGATRDERLAPVGGMPLWSPEWCERFAAAAYVSSYRFAQNEYSVEQVVRPLLSVARRFRLDDRVGLAVLLDRSVAVGAAAAERWVERVLAAGNPEPIAQLRRALAGDERAALDRYVAALGAFDGPPSVGNGARAA